MEQKQATCLNEYITCHRKEIVDDLISIVNAQSPTTDKISADHCADVISFLAKERLGITLNRNSQPNYGDHLSFSSRKRNVKKVLLIGHYDTVLDIKSLPIRITEEQIGGPGIFDMKFGIVSAIWAQKAIKDLKLPCSLGINMRFSSDTEAGSPTSRSLVENHAKKSDVVIALEPSENGAVKTARKGVGKFVIEVSGLAAHAGANYEYGRSAILEAARIIEFLHSLSDSELGTTVNVGLINGGVSRNVIADYARMEVDVRVCTKAEGQRVLSQIYGLLPHQDGISINVIGDMHRPPFERTVETERLFDTVRNTAKSLGFSVEETSAGDAGDGNFTSSLGIPTIDGMGAVGDGSHSLHEHISVTPSLKRIALLAGFLCDLSK